VGSNVEEVALEAGVTAYLEKPYFPEELTDIIDGIVQ